MGGYNIPAICLHGLARIGSAQSKREMIEKVVLNHGVVVSARTGTLRNFLRDVLAKMMRRVDAPYPFTFLDEADIMLGGLTPGNERVRYMEMINELLEGRTVRRCPLLTQISATLLANFVRLLNCADFKLHSVTTIRPPEEGQAMTKIRPWRMPAAPAAPAPGGNSDGQGGNGSGGAAAEEGKPVFLPTLSKNDYMPKVIVQYVAEAFEPGQRHHHINIRVTDAIKKQGTFTLTDVARKLDEGLIAELGASGYKAALMFKVGGPFYYKGGMAVTAVGSERARLRAVLAAGREGDPALLPEYRDSGADGYGGAADFTLMEHWDRLERFDMQQAAIPGYARVVVRSGTRRAAMCVSKHFNIFVAYLVRLLEEAEGGEFAGIPFIYVMGTPAGRSNSFVAIDFLREPGQRTVAALTKQVFYGGPGMNVGNLKQAFRRPFTSGLTDFYKRCGHADALARGVAVLAPEHAFAWVSQYDAFFEYLGALGEAEVLRRVEEHFHGPLRQAGRLAFFFQGDRLAEETARGRLAPTEQAQAFADACAAAFHDAPDEIARFLSLPNILVYNAVTLNSATRFAGGQLLRRLGIAASSELRPKNRLALYHLRSFLELFGEEGCHNRDIKAEFSTRFLTRLEDSSTFVDPAAADGDQGPFDMFELMNMQMRRLAAARRNREIIPLFAYTFGIEVYAEEGAAPGKRGHGGARRPVLCYRALLDVQPPELVEPEDTNLLRQEEAEEPEPAAAGAAQAGVAEEEEHAENAAGGQQEGAP